MAAARSTQLVTLVLVLAATACGGGESASSYEPPAAPEPVLEDTLSPKACQSWMGGSNLLAICDPDLLSEAWENHTLNKPGTVEVEIPGRRLRVGSNPALTQIFPDDGRGGGLEPGDTVAVRGRVSSGSYLFLRASSFEDEHVAFGEALFHDLGLERGGTATIDVELDDGRIVFVTRRPDGSLLEPLRSSHREGPGPRARVESLPDGYADSPAQAVETYVAAINAHDGKTICQLFAPSIAETFTTEHSHCWLAVAGHIGYGEESGSAIFQAVDLLEIGDTYTKSNFGVTFTAVPVKVRFRYLEHRYGEARTTNLRDIVWLQEIDGRWHLGKPSLTLLAAMGGGAEDALAVPDPLAAQHAREAEEREERRRAAGAQATVVTVRSGGVRCVGDVRTIADGRGDPEVLFGKPGPSAKATSDIVSVGVAASGRRVCMTMKLGRAPRNGRMGIRFHYAPLSGAQSGDSFMIVWDGPQVRAGRSANADVNELEAAGATVAASGSTVTASFVLDAALPAITPRTATDLHWSVWAYEVDREARWSVQDRAPAPSQRAERVVRQGDGAVVLLR